jgi:hypothetical protein
MAVAAPLKLGAKIDMLLHQSRLGFLGFQHTVKNNHSLSKKAADKSNWSL